MNRKEMHVVMFRYVVKSGDAAYPGLSTLRIEPVRVGDNNTEVICAADNAVGKPVHATATLIVLNKGLQLRFACGFRQCFAHASLLRLCAFVFSSVDDGLPDDRAGPASEGGREGPHRSGVVRGQRRAAPRSALAARSDPRRRGTEWALHCGHAR